jgi:hypothetical protein
MEHSLYRVDGLPIVGGVLVAKKSNTTTKKSCKLLCCTSGTVNPGHLPGINLNRGSYWPSIYRDGKPYANDDVGWSKVYHHDYRRR